MKKLLTTLIAILGLSTAYAVAPFSSPNVGYTPVNGYVLQTNGATSTWVATSTLGIVGGSGISNAYGSSTFVTYQYGSSTYTGGGISNLYASSTFATSTGLWGNFPTYTYATNTYYLATNPTGFITSASLTPYPTLTYGSSTYYLATNPSAFITASALTPYVTLTYGTATYATLSSLANYVLLSYATSTFPTFTYASSSYYLATNPSSFITSSALTPYTLLSYGTSTFPTFTYSSTTHPTFSYGTSTYYLNTNPSSFITNSVSNLTNYPTYTYATGTFVNYTYASTTRPSFTYGTSTYYLNTNPSAFITNAVSNLTNYPTYTYASNTLASYAYGSSTYLSGGGITNLYASTTFPSFAYGSTTYLAGAGITNAYGSSTFVTYAYGSSTYGGGGGISNTYASSTFLTVSNPSATGTLNLATTTSGTSTTPTNGIYITAKPISGRDVLSIRSTLSTPGVNGVLQNAFWNSSQTWFTPGIAGAGLWQGTAGTNLGTPARVLPTTTNPYTMMLRTNFPSVITTNNQQVGTRSDAMFFRGSGQTGAGAPKRGGFFFKATIGLSTWTTNNRLFVGLSTCTAACVTGTSSLSILTNTIGFGVDGRSNTLVFLTNDASGVISTTTINGQPPLATNNVYDMYMYQAPDDGQVFWRLDNASTTQMIAEGMVNSNLPATTTLLVANAAMSNAGNIVAGNATIGVVKIYVETER